MCYLLSYKDKIFIPNKKTFGGIKYKIVMINIYRILYNNNIIYVGKTILTLKKRKSLPNYSVPIEIYKQSTIELIEETEDVSRERYWITYYKENGHQLMNKRNGDHSDETKTDYYLNRLLISKTKKSFVKMTDEEKKEKRAKYREDNKEKIKKKRKEDYNTGRIKSWKGSKGYMDMLKRKKEERGFIKKGKS